MKTYIVQDGDTPQAIASLFGFKQWSNIYEHKANEKLRGQRGPNELKTGDAVSIPDAYAEVMSGSSAQLQASELVSLPPVVIDAHMHIMSGNCLPFPVLNYTQLEVKARFMANPSGSRRTLNTVGNLFSFLPMLRIAGWSHRSTLKIGHDTVKSNDSLPSTIRKTPSTKHLRDGQNSFLGISIALPMDMDLCHLDGYKGRSVYEVEPQPDGDPRYTFNVRLTGRLDEREDKIYAHPLEWRAYQKWSEQVLETKLACSSKPLRLIPMYHYEPRRFIQWTGKSATLAANWDVPFKHVATQKKEGLFAGFKMYTPQGYTPTDELVPSLEKFFARCASDDIPIMTHCTPSGHYTHDRKLFIDLDPAAAEGLSQEDKDAYKEASNKREKYLDAKEHLAKAEKKFDGYMRQYGLPQDAYAWGMQGELTPMMPATLPSDPEYWKAYDEYQTALSANDEAQEAYDELARELRLTRSDPKRLKYFKEKYLHPDAWALLMQKNPTLRLCLAHFASDKHIWWGYHDNPGGPCRDGDGVTYDRNWVSAIVELCEKYKHFYTDLSYLPLMRSITSYDMSGKEQKRYEKKADAVRYWSALAKVCKHEHMLKKIMFGTDWYMILAEPMGYQDWFKEAMEGLALVEAELKLPRKVNLFYQFAIVNPMRFYGLGKIADNLKKGIETFMNGPEVDKRMKKKHFQDTPEKLQRNYTILKNLAAVLDTLEKEAGEDGALLYEDQVRFVNVLADS
ncbi:hypothetical protein ACN28E_46835 [Archangium lansingense]|uniref:hypothetical protein n=1 Tax=Archangium lansingense TaxID=2995310 RepID=UPI003B7B8A64